MNYTLTGERSKKMLIKILFINITIIVTSLLMLRAKAGHGEYHVYANLFYIPIFTATLWWGRRGGIVWLIVAAFMYALTNLPGGQSAESFVFQQKSLFAQQDILRVVLVFFVWVVFVEVLRFYKREIHNTHKRTYSILENMSDGQIVYQPTFDGNDFLIVDINPACERIEKIKKNDVVGKSILDVFPGIIDFGLFDLLQEVYRTGEPQQMCNAYYSDDRISGWRENSIYKLETGEIVVICRDTTQLKKVEEEKEASLKQYQELWHLARLMCDNLPVALWAKDLKGKYLFLNKVHCQFFFGSLNTIAPVGHTYNSYRQILQTKKQQEIFSFNADHCEIEQKVITTKQAMFFCTEGRLNTSVHSLEVYISPLFNENKKMIGIVGSAKDVTAEKRITREKVAAEKKQLELEKLLYRSQRIESIGLFASGITHDLNNFLMPVLGYAELLLESFSEESEEFHYIQSIIQGANMAKKLIAQIKILNQTSDVPNIPINLKKLIGEVVHLMRSIKPPHVTISCKFHDNYDILADPTQLSQVFMNLITNAFQAMAHTGDVIKITIESVLLEKENPEQLTLLPGNYMIIAVSDNGPGMTAEVLEKIFDPYFTTKKQSGGTGLGLSVTYSIIHALKGTIVVSSAVNQGTKFRIYIPKYVKTFQN
ncbi:MAG: PAS domain-containing protein [Bacteroidetes bacterium]|nr:PAS domain-containing protein [Bacteroidota bacterium]